MLNQIINLDLNAHGILNLLVGIINIIFGFLVLAKDHRSKANRSFCYLLTASSIWVIGFGMISMATTQAQSYFWLKFSYFFGVPYISFLFYIFSVQWTGLKPNKVGIWIGVIMALLLSFILVMFGENIYQFKVFTWGRYNILKPGLPPLTYFSVLLIYFFGYAWWSFFVFLKAYKQTKNPAKKTLYKFFLIAFLFVYTGSTDFLVTATGKYYPFGYISLTFYLFLITYSIIWHEFLNIKIIAKRAALMSIIYLGLLILFLPILYFIGDYWISKSNTHLSVITLVLSIPLALLFSSGPALFAFLINHNYWLKGQLSAGLTHELKSPIGVIEGAIEILTDTLKSPHPNKKKIEEYITLIKNNSSRLNQTINDLLTTAQTKKEIHLHKSLIKFRKLVGDVIDRYESLAKSKGLVILNQVNENLEVYADKQKLDQAISNLLSNAIKYSNEGEIICWAEMGEKVMEFHIKDHGLGIEEKHLASIFDRFFQIHTTSKGSGVGLSIAKAWIEAHGGKIWAHSEGLNKGTTMVFILPY